MITHLRFVRKLQPELSFEPTDEAGDADPQKDQKPGQEINGRFVAHGVSLLLWYSLHERI